MPDADKSLEILIKTKADLKDAIALREELERGILRAKLLGKSFADQQASLDRVNGAIKAFTGSTNESGKSTKLFEGHMGEVKKSIRELAGEFPIASKALMLLTNPVGGALAIGIGMFALAKEKLDDWNKSLDEMGEKAAKPDFADAIKARKDALEAGAIASAQYQDKMEHLIDPEERYQKEVQATIALLQQRAAAANEVADAKLGFDTSELGHNHDLQTDALKRQLDTGLITYDQFTLLKSKLDEDYFKRLSDLEIKHDQERVEREKKLRADTLAEEEKALQHAQEQQPKLQSAATGARAAATNAQASADKTAADLAEAQSHKDEDAKHLQDIIDRIKKFPQSGGTEAGGLARLRLIEQGVGIKPELLDEYEKAVAIINSRQGTAEKATGALPGQKTSAALATSAADRAEARAEANAQRIQEAQEKITAEKAANKTADDAADYAAVDRRNAMRNKTRAELGKLDLGGGYTGGDVENMGALEQRRKNSFVDPAHFKPLTDAENKTLDAFEKYAASRGAWNEAFMRTLVQSANVQAAGITRLEALEKTIEDLNSRIKGLNNK
jgi:hypothetical protein